MTEQRYVMKGPKIFENNVPSLNPNDLGFKIGKPLTEEEFREVKSKENVKLLHCEEASNISGDSSSSSTKEELRKKMREKLEKLKSSRTNKER